MTYRAGGMRPTSLPGKAWSVQLKSSLTLLNGSRKRFRHAMVPGMIVGAFEFGPKAFNFQGETSVWINTEFQRSSAGRDPTGGQARDAPQTQKKGLPPRR
jgi:hypothetical protein